MNKRSGVFLFAVAGVLLCGAAGTPETGSTSGIHAVWGTAVLLLLIGMFLIRQRARNKFHELETRHRLQLQTVAEFAQIAFFRCSADGGLKSRLSNPAFWGREADGVTPLPIEQWVDERDLPAIRAQWRRLFAGETDSVAVEYRSVSPAVRHFEMYARRIQPENGGEPELYGIIREVTQEKLAAEREQDISRMLQALLENLPCYIYTKDAETLRYTLCNKMFRSSFNLPPDEIIGKTDDDLFPADEAARLIGDEKLTIRTGGERECVAPFTGANGVTRIGRFFYKLLPMANGRQSLLGLVIDITEEEQRERELRQSNTLLQAIMDNLPCSLFVKDADRDFRYLMYNRVFTEQFSLGGKEVIGRNDPELLPPEIAALCLESDRQAVKADSAQITHETAMLADGREHVLHNTKSLIVHEDGRRLLLGLNVDMTEETRMVRELQIYAKRQQLVTSCLEAILLNEGDEDSAIQLVLHAVYDHLKADRCYTLIFDYENDRMVPGVEYYQPGDRVVVGNLPQLPIPRQEPWFKRLERHQLLFFPDTASEETRSIFGCWAEYAVFWEIRSIYCAGIHCDGRLWGDIGICYEKEHYTFSEQDRQLLETAAHMIEIILARKQSRAQLTRALVDAQNASKAKSFFLATMSHELRTPLNAVIGFSELLRNSTLPPEEQQDYLASINLAGNALLSLINDILDLSKIEADQLEIVAQPTDVAALAEEMQAIFRQKAQEKSLELKLVIPQELPMLELDCPRLRQILLNLIGNAIKFTPQGSVTVSADFQPAGPERGVLQLCVSDTGIGITQESQATIFDPFVQQDAVRDTHTYHGTGLGLAICRRLTDKMGGTIQLESELNRGSRFTVRLDGVPYAAPPSRTETAQQQKDAFFSPDCRVLLVDDVPMNLKVLQAMLRKLKVESVCAASGEEALEILAQDREFQFVLTDLWMPGMSGEELARKIHETPAIAHLPVIAVTADSQISDDQSGKFQGVLLKPVSLEALQLILPDGDVVRDDGSGI